jgi:hypothetical protein
MALLKIPGYTVERFFDCALKDSHRHVFTDPESSPVANNMKQAHSENEAAVPSSSTHLISGQLHHAETPNLTESIREKERGLCRTVAQLTLGLSFLFRGCDGSVVQ